MKKYSILGLLIILLLSIPASGCSALFPGLEENVDRPAMDLIADQIRSQQADPDYGFLLGLDEIPIDLPDIQPPIKVYRVDQGPYFGETFVLQGDAVHHLGTAFGGFGVASLLVTDLDHDGNSELTYSYSFGSGIHQSRIGMLDPARQPAVIIEADFTYLGDIGLDQQGDEIQVRLIEPNPGGIPTEFQDVIGTLQIQEIDSEKELHVQVRDELAKEVREKIIRPPDNPEQ